MPINRRRTGIVLAFAAGLLGLAVTVQSQAVEEIKLSGGVLVEKIARQPYAATDSKLQAAIKGARLIIIGEPNYQMMQRMVGRERKGAKAYFVFRPDLGTPIFDNDPKAAMEIPLKIVLLERGATETAIRYKKPSSVLADYKGLEALGKELDQLIGQVTDAAVK